MESEGDLAHDLLVGVPAIREFLGPTFTDRMVYHLVEKGSIPVIRRPGSKTIFGRKSQLRRAFSEFA